MAILQVVIGIVFILLLLSLFATTIMELLAAGLSLRGKNLEKALKNMLASTDIDEHILQAFKDNSLYRQLSFQYGKKRVAPPSYMSADSFQSILFDIILKGKTTSIHNLKEELVKVADKDLQNVLFQLMQDAEENLDMFKGEVMKWYENIMDRASGWYKRLTQKILVVVGIAIAVAFNADTIAIYQHLSSDPAALASVVNMAEKFVADNEDNDTLGYQATDPELQETIDNLKSLMENQINQINPVGWQNIEVAEMDATSWVMKALGWVVTALAISLGAPFWFDLLRKIVNVRSSGNKP